MTERDPERPATPPGRPVGATATPAPQEPVSAGGTTPEYSARPVAFRGPESLGGLLLILAGVAAAISLVLDWLADADISGWSLVRGGFDDLAGSFANGLWQPLVIVLGGGALFVLGLLMWLPMRSHRFFGVLALLVTLAVTAGLLVPLADAGLGPRLLRARVLVRDRRRRPRTPRQPQGAPHTAVHRTAMTLPYSGPHRGQVPSP
jgi:hypothetical protein